MNTTDQARVQRLMDWTAANKLWLALALLVALVVKPIFVTEKPQGTAWVYILAPVGLILGLVVHPAFAAGGGLLWVNHTFGGILQWGGEALGRPLNK